MIVTYLRGAQQVDHRVEAEDIKSFWSTMWNKNDYTGESNSFDEYLLSYLPATDKQITFPAYAEFHDIIKYLPN